MIGHCIAEWASVDDELFNIFQNCVGPRDQSAIIYFRIPSLSTRFDLTDEIVRSVLPRPTRPRKSGGHDHPSVKAWDAAKNGYQPLLGIRSRIAHHLGQAFMASRQVGAPWNTPLIGVNPCASAAND